MEQTAQAVQRALATLTSAVDELACCDAAALGDPEVVVALARSLTRMEAVVSRATAAFEASGAFGEDGSRSAAAWCATHCHLAPREARRSVRLGHEMAEMPLFAAAYEDGELSSAHLEVAAQGVSGRCGDAFRRDEAMLVAQAKALSFSDFTRAMAYFVQLADPDGTEERAEAQRARRDVVLTQSYAGTWLGQMTLDPTSGSIVASELTRLEQELFALDWEEAKGRLGREPRTGELARSVPQRRADALVEMATRSKAMPPDAVRPLPLLSVFVGYETLQGRILELANGTVISPGSLLPYLDSAMIERAVFTPRGRVEVSATARLFSGATRRAIELRDRRCQHPSCDVSLEYCQVDHIVPHGLGGATTQENGRLLCPAHNRMRNGELMSRRWDRGRDGRQPEQRSPEQRPPPRE